ncbi:hypothetical protein ASF69_19985 [Rhizobium sp. Leaf311]|uniref:cytochrome P450 n=1 Tax=Rhizobium sp. Leaf311 TaxID=1736332 RepID=UPI0007143E16|nr:cytochrome P450 [Rhizobium sp. Leaf311]KQQ54211.1 hypothetical protein ASF69_19985 [Rhizobium sp. Leaf311]
MLTIAELDANPQAAFKRWRSKSPIVEYEGGGLFVLRHADVVQLSSDPRIVATEAAIPESRGVTEGILHEFFSLGMLTANGAPHERRRSIMSRALSTVLTKELRTSVRNATEDLIDTVYAQGTAEFVSQFADKVTVLALAGILGVPQEERAVFVSHVGELSRFFSPASTVADIAKSAEAATFLRDYLMRKMAQTHTGAGFMDAIREAAEDAGVSPVEAAIQIIQLIIGGNESVRAAIVAQTSLLLLHKSQWNAVCEDQSLVAAAVSEAMRYQPGIAGMVRATADEIELHGHIIPAHTLLILSTISALRDETVYQHPDTFDIHRGDLARDHLAFGAGSHRCAADHLARIELEECLSVFTRRLPKLRLEDIPVFNGHIFVRMPSHFCVSWPV